MKHTLHKLFSLLLCLVLLLSLAPMALAEEESLLDEAALDRWIQDYLQQHGIGGGNQLFSVGFCYTATGDCWFYNADKFMYSASMYKVPVAMLLAEKEAAGLINQDTDLGGGTLRYLESTALTFSNNDSGHAMLNYLGEDNSGKASKLCMKYASLDQAYYDQDFFDYSYYSARFITQVMETLCAGGEERFPHVIENLLIAQPDSYLNLSLSGKYQVAQKYGAFQERNGNSNNHITAIVYTPNPIIVTVMTRNVDDFQQRMADIGEYLANYALELDEKLSSGSRPRPRRKPRLQPRPQPKRSRRPSPPPGSPSPAARRSRAEEPGSCPPSTSSGLPLRPSVCWSSSMRFSIAKAKAAVALAPGASSGGAAALSPQIGAVSKREAEIAVGAAISRPAAGNSPKM